MTEVEQLRKEVNELRERLALLENTVRPIGPGVSTQPVYEPVYGHRYTPQPPTNPYQPPFVVTCESKAYTQPELEPGQVF